MNNTKEKRPPLSAVAGTFWWGSRLLWRSAPGSMVNAMLYALFHAVAPYLSLWFSAQLLDGIAAGAPAAALWRLAAAAAGSAAIVGIIFAGARFGRDMFASSAYRRLGMLLTDKMAGMDYARMDDPKTKQQLSDIMQGDNWMGHGLGKLIWIWTFALPWLFEMLCAGVLAAGLFTHRVPADSTLAFLDGVPVILVLVAIMLFNTWFSLWAGGRAGTATARQADVATLGNRLFLYYFRPLYVDDRETALDIRAHGQATFFADGISRDNLFSEKGPMAAITRRDISPWRAATYAGTRLFGMACYFYVGLKAWAGAFGVGGVAMYVGAVSGFANALARLARMLIGDVYENHPFLQKLRDFLSLPNEMYQGTLSVEKRSDRQYKVEFRHVSFRYPGSEVWALRDVNFSFDIGRRLAVVGENGSGKTTFIKLLCRLYDPTEGQILLNGIDIRKYDHAQYQRIFSVVFQDFGLVAASLGANVAGAGSWDEAAMAQALQKAGLTDLVKTLPQGVHTPLYRELDENGFEPSGGEAQKTAIARALYKDAAFIVLDEPTAALDPLAEAAIYADFDKLIQDRTAIYISHRLSSCRFCDDIVVFADGRIAQQGPHEALLADADGLYARLWGAQAQYYT